MNKALMEQAEERNRQFDLRMIGILETRKGIENAASRRDLIWLVFGIVVPSEVSLTSLQEDREIRKSIARLQKKYPIVSTSSEGGYFLAASGEEVLRYTAEIHSRAFSLLDKARNLKEIADNYFKGQATQPPISEVAL